MTVDQELRAAADELSEVIARSPVPPLPAPEHGPTQSDRRDHPLRRRLAVAGVAAAALLAVVGIVNLSANDTDTVIVQQPPPADDTSVPFARGPVVPSDGAEPVTPGRSAASGVTRLPDIDNAVVADEGGPPLPLGMVDTLPNEDRLDFLFEFCGDGCYRDAHFMDPASPDMGSGGWVAGRPFHVRHGFVNEGTEPLGPGFDVAVYAYPMDIPTEFGGVVTGQTYRHSSDYVLRGEAEQCGPTYKSQTGPVTCEWFVHDFPDGLSQGRWAIWAVWEAPCSAWIGYGLTETCTEPHEVLSLFSSGVDSPFDPSGSGAPSYDETNMATMTPAEIDEFFAALEGRDARVG